ncbi:MAG: hypothetical protein ABFQ53_01700 [Patescibacteria group bacterium]
MCIFLCVVTTVTFEPKSAQAEDLDKYLVKLTTLLDELEDSLEEKSKEPPLTKEIAKKD